MIAPIPGPRECSAAAPAAQAPIAAQPYHDWRFPDGTTSAHFFRVAAHYLVRFPGLADFTISHDGLEVVCTPVPGILPATVDHLFVNQVQPLAQARAGALVFHCSAVVIDGGAIAFAGPSGRGKSTLAASFATAGFEFMTDDALGVRVSGAEFIAHPGHPSLRLWADSSEALIPPGTPQAAPVQYTPKQRHLSHTGLRFCADAKPLRAVVVLAQEPSDEVTLARLDPAAAVIELVRQSFLLDLDRKDALAVHFDEIARVARSVPFLRMRYPRSFDALAQVRGQFLSRIAAPEYADA